MHPTDELADVRNRIKALKEREQELRASLAMQRRDLVGARFEAMFTRSTRRVFLKERLPDYILAAPELWKEQVTTTLRVKPLQPAVAEDPDDDVILIETWREDSELKRA